MASWLASVSSGGEDGDSGSDGGGRYFDGSLAELFSVLAGAHSEGGGVFGFLTLLDGNELRQLCRLFRDDVAAAHWCDGVTPIKGSLAARRACFPGAGAANVGGRRDLRDADFVHLAGVKVLHMWDCPGVTDAGLAHLAGLHTLDASWCTGLTDSGMESLVGVNTLNISGCDGIGDAGLAHLAGVQSLDMGWCVGITGAGVARLSGIHSLDMYGCTGVTDAGLAHLSGIHTLDLHGCSGVTDAGMAHIAGVNTLDISRDVNGKGPQISADGLAHLAGVHALRMQGWGPAATAAARKLGLSVVL